MTSTDVAVTENYPVGTVAAERVRLAEQVRVAVLFEGRQHDVTLPASSPVAAVADSLVRVLLTREGSDDGMRKPDDDRMISPGRGADDVDQWATAGSYPESHAAGCA